MRKTGRGGIRPHGLAYALLALLAFATASTAAGGDLRGMAPLEQRERLLALFRQDRVQAIPALAEALDAEAPFVRRTAAHLLVRAGRPAAAQLEAALGLDDAEVRTIAIRGLAEMGLLAEYAGALLNDEQPFVRHALRLLLARSPMPEEDARDAFIAQLARMYEGAQPSEREEAVRFLAAVKSPGPHGERLLLAAAADEAEEIRAIAYGRLFEIVDRESERGREIMAAAKGDESPAIREKAHVAAGTYDSAEARERDFQAAWGHRPAIALDAGELRVALEAPLPADGWQFRLDRDRTGHEKGWFRPGFDDNGWMDARIEAFWHEFLGYRYVGVGWYRRTFDAPAFPDGASVYLHFGAVDESAWVWINGELAGHHHVGPVGWNDPFFLDATGLLRPGEANHIAVRAMNTGGAGGVWLPVRLVAVEEL